MAMQLISHDNTIHEKSTPLNNYLCRPPPFSDDTVPQFRPASPASREVDFLTQGIHRSLPGSWERKESWRNKRKERPRFISSRIYPGSERNIFKPRLKNGLKIREGIRTAAPSSHYSKVSLYAEVSQNGNSLKFDISKNSAGLFTRISKTKHNGQPVEKNVNADTFQGISKLSPNNLIEFKSDKFIKLNREIRPATWNSCFMAVESYKYVTSGNDLNRMNVCETC